MLSMHFKGASEGWLAIFLFNNLWDSVPDYVLVVKGCKAAHCIAAMAAIRTAPSVFT